jgi:hypothetical protein
MPAPPVARAGAKTQESGKKLTGFVRLPRLELIKNGATRQKLSL